MNIFQDWKFSIFQIDKTSDSCNAYITKINNPEGETLWVDVQ
jgi:hypothetical protein